MMDTCVLFWIVLFCFFDSTSHYALQTQGEGFPVEMPEVETDPTESYVNFVIFVLACAALFIYTSVMVFIFTSIVYSKFVMHKSVGRVRPEEDMPGVSIVKPLMGVDPLLEHNLLTHFQLTYPKFELLFCFHDDQDAAITLVKQLHERFPHVDIKIFIGGKKEIINPMVQNMAPAYEAAQYEFVWINSSRIEVSDEIIYDMAQKLQKDSVSLVHQMPFYSTNSTGFGSSVEKIYFGCHLARYYISFSLVGLCCVTGMSYMFKKALLDEANGLAWFGRYLAEDYFLTRALHKRGSLVLSAFPARQNVGQTTVCGFTDRMVRWLRLRINMMPVVTLTFEPIIDCFPLGIWVAWACYYFFSINPIYLFICHVIFWIILDYVLLCNIQNGPLAFSKIHYVIAWMVREISSTYIYIAALANLHTIKWGPRSFKVKFGGLVEGVQCRDSSQDVKKEKHLLS